MKKSQIKYWFPVALLVVIIIEIVYAKQNGRAGNTGSPGETACNATGCHTGNSLNSGGGSITITSNIPATGYIPGTTYNMSVTVSKASVPLFGFGIEALKTGNTSTGTFVITNTVQTQILVANSRPNVTHKLNGGLSTGSKTFSFNWTAPATNVGNVTFYSAGVAANNNGNSTGDFVYTTSAMVSAAANTIATANISGSPFCIGQTGINIPFTVNYAFNTGNIFTAQLSDASGSFATPLNLGTLSGIASGTITSSVAIPNTPGSNYRIRVIGSNPATTGTDNGTDLAINPPLVADAGTDQIICNDSIVLNANNPPAGSGSWTIISGAGSFSSANDPVSVVTNFFNGINTYRWTVSDGVCTPAFDEVAINSVAPVSEVDAGADQAVCDGIAVLNADSITAGQGNWSVLTGNAAFANISDPKTAVSNLAPGVNKLVWTITNAPCMNVSDTVEIISYLSPTSATAGTDQLICDSTGTLIANNPAIGTGSWARLSGSGNIVNVNNDTTGVNGIGIGESVFTWTIANGVCGPSVDTVVVTRINKPTIANAGTDQTACVNYATLSANAPIIGSGQWSLVSGSGNIVAPNDTITMVTNLGAGANVFKWTISNSVCIPSMDEIEVTRTGSITIPNAGQDTTICQDTIALYGNAVLVGSGTWSLISGSGTIVNTSDSASLVTGLGIGNNVFRWTISNDTCTPLYDEMIITVKAEPTVANAGADQNICLTTAHLAANAPLIGTGSWTLVSGAGIIANPSAPNSAVTGLGNGFNKFVWTISNSPCYSTSDTVVINKFGSITPADAGEMQILCDSSTVCEGNVAAPHIGLWTLLSGTGTFSNASSAVSAVSGLSVGDNVFVWTISNSTCPPSMDTVIYRVVPFPTVANAGSDMEVCDSVILLSANSAVVGQGQWTLQSGAGVIMNPADSVTTVTGLGTGNNVFRWTISNVPCNASTDEITIIRKEIPTVSNAGIDQTICSNNVTMAANAPAIGSGQWTLVSGNGIFANASDPSTLVYGLVQGSTSVYRWTIKNSPCDSSFSDVTINNCNNNSIVTGAVTGSPFCSNTSYNLSISFTSTGIFNGFYAAELSDASGSFANPVVIGASSASPISAVIPSGTPAGSAYRIRIVNSNPNTIGTDNGADLSINTCLPNAISTDAVSGSPFCANTSYNLNVYYTITGNVTGSFRAELSNSSGSFATPVTIGTGTGNPIVCVIPSSTPNGNAYRIRVVNTSVGITGTDNGANLAINNCMAIYTDSISGSPFCSTTTYNVSVPFTTVGSFTGPFNAQLSDASGNFASPLTIGYANNSPITATFPSGMPTGSNYRIRVVNNNSGVTGTINSNNLYINTCGTGTRNNAVLALFQIYPNPNTGSFSLVYEQATPEILHLVVTDVLGNMVLKQSHEAVTQKGNVEVSLNNVSPGIYYLRVSTDKICAIRKIIIE